MLDGFTIFPTKSSDYMSGYRAGVIQANKDVQNFDKLGGIDARQEHIKCPPDSVNADWCSGYKDGYSDEAMDQLEYLRLENNEESNYLYTIGSDINCSIWMCVFIYGSDLRTVD